MPSSVRPAALEDPKRVLDDLVKKVKEANEKGLQITLVEMRGDETGEQVVSLLEEQIQHINSFIEGVLKNNPMEGEIDQARESAKKLTNSAEKKSALEEIGYFNFLNFASDPEKDISDRMDYALKIKTAQLRLEELKKQPSAASSSAPVPVPVPASVPASGPVALETAGVGNCFYEAIGQALVAGLLLSKKPHSSCGAIVEQLNASLILMGLQHDHPGQAQIKIPFFIDTEVGETTANEKMKKVFSEYKKEKNGFGEDLKTFLTTLISSEKDWKWLVGFWIRDSFARKLNDSKEKERYISIFQDALLEDYQVFSLLPKQEETIVDGVAVTFVSSHYGDESLHHEFSLSRTLEAVKLIENAHSKEELKQQFKKLTEKEKETFIKSYINGAIRQNQSWASPVTLDLFKESFPNLISIAKPDGKLKDGCLDNPIKLRHVNSKNPNGNDAPNHYEPILDSETFNCFNDLKPVDFLIQSAQLSPAFASSLQENREEERKEERKEEPVASPLSSTSSGNSSESPALSSSASPKSPASPVIEEDDDELSAGLDGVAFDPAPVSESGPEQSSSDSESDEIESESGRESEEEDEDEHEHEHDSDDASSELGEAQPLHSQDVESLNTIETWLKDEFGAALKRAEKAGFEETQSYQDRYDTLAGSLTVDMSGKGPFELVDIVSQKKAEVSELIKEFNEVITKKGEKKKAQSQPTIARLKEETPKTYVEFIQWLYAEKVADKKEGDEDKQDAKVAVFTKGDVQPTAVEINKEETPLDESAFRGLEEEEKQKTKIKLSYGNDEYALLSWKASELHAEHSPLNENAKKDESSKKAALKEHYKRLAFNLFSAYQKMDRNKTCFKITRLVHKEMEGDVIGFLHDAGFSNVIDLNGKSHSNPNMVSATAGKGSDKKDSKKEEDASRDPIDSKSLTSKTTSACETATKKVAGVVKQHWRKPLMLGALTTGAYLLNQYVTASSVSNGSVSNGEDSPFLGDIPVGSNFSHPSFSTDVAVSNQLVPFSSVVSILPVVFSTLYAQLPSVVPGLLSAAWLSLASATSQVSTALSPVTRGRVDPVSNRSGVEIVEIDKDGKAVVGVNNSVVLGSRDLAVQNCTADYSLQRFLRLSAESAASRFRRLFDRSPNEEAQIQQEVRQGSNTP